MRQIALVDSSAVKIRTLMLWSSIPAAVVDIAIACKYMFKKLSCIYLNVRP